MFFKPKKVEVVDPFAEFPDAVMMVDEDGSIVYVNEKACLLFGYEKDFLLENEIFLLFDNGLEIIKKVATIDSPAITKAKPYESVDLYVEVSTIKLQEDGKYLVTYRDVTQNHKVVSRLLVEFENAKKFIKDKNGFLAKLTNKVKSPLHSVVGFSQALLDKLGGPLTEKQEKYLGIINKNSKETMQLLDKVFELSKIESGLYEYEFKNFDFVLVMNAVIAQFKPEIDAKKLQIEVDAQDVIRRNCYSDETVVKTILTSLIDNAVKSSADQGLVNIRIETPDEETLSSLNLEPIQGTTEKSFILFSISDSGGGFMEDEVPLVFDPYTIIEKNANKNVLKNIGFAISKHLIRHLKGKIWLESKPLKGAKFSFIIPIEKLGN